MGMIRNFAAKAKRSARLEGLGYIVVWCCVAAEPHGLRRPDLTLRT
jgi:hypothetical protein